MSIDPNTLCDAIAVNQETKKVRVLKASTPHENAEGVVALAVMRQGCEVDFFTVVSAGKYAEGSTYTPQ